jgi:23S rRNA pseudouridine1911/1915/1917 synthase
VERAPLNRGFTYTNEIDAGAAGETVVDFYTRRYPHSTAAQWRERIERGTVRLDGHEVSPTTLLRAGQTLSYERAPWDEPETPTSFGVLYEDAHVIAVDKPSGLPVLPGGHHLEHTLLALVRARFAVDNSSEVPPSPLHRLGRATSGIVLFARTPLALRRLTEAFSERRITKIYRALVQGVGLTDEQTIDVPIGRIDYAPTGKLYAAASGGAPSTSICRLLDEDAGQHRSLVEVRIITGRPHQIRIHMAAIGHPLVGDPLYIAGGLPTPLIPGNRPPLPGDCGYHLHAMRLTFHHPITNDPLNLFSPPPSPLRAPGERP